MSLDTNNKIKKEVQKALGVLDNIENIEAPPFLYTRIKANLNEQDKRSPFSFASVLASPRIALVLLLFILNLTSVVFFLSKNDAVISEEKSFIGSLTDDYYLSLDNDILNQFEQKE